MKGALNKNQTKVRGPDGIRSSRIINEHLNESSMNVHVNDVNDV